MHYIVSFSMQYLNVLFFALHLKNNKHQFKGCEALKRMCLLWLLTILHENLEPGPFITCPSLAYPSLHFCCPTFYIYHTLFPHAPLPMPSAKRHWSPVLLGSPGAAPVAAGKDLLGCCSLSLKYNAVQGEPNCHSTSLSQWLRRHISSSRGTALLRFWFQLSNISGSLLNNLNFYHVSKQQTHLHQNFKQKLTDKERQTLNGENFSLKWRC